MTTRAPNTDKMPLTHVCKGDDLLAHFKRESWPETTDTCCWWCCHSFETTPIPGTVGFDSRKDQFLCRGVFCSWSCAKSFLMETGRNWSMNCMYLAQLRRRVEGKLIPITPAPNRFLLEMFGGTFSIERFRQQGNSGCIVKVLPPLLIESHHVTKVVVDTSDKRMPSESVSATLSSKITSTNMVNNTFRLKRDTSQGKKKMSLVEHMKMNVSSTSS